MGTNHTDLLEAIQFYMICQTAPDVIAERLHISLADVLHMQRTGKMPQRQLSLQWADDGQLREVAQ